MGAGVSAVSGSMGAGVSGLRDSVVQSLGLPALVLFGATVVTRHSGDRGSEELFVDLRV